MNAERIDWDRRIGLPDGISLNKYRMKYHVLTGLVHGVCKPYRTNSYLKAVVALLYRRLIYCRGYILTNPPSKEI